MTNTSPRIKLRGVGGVVDVVAVVTIGYYMRCRDGVLKYFCVKDCLYCPEAQAELYPTRAAFEQLNSSHHFDDLCFIQFTDGSRVPFQSTTRGYKVDAFYGKPPSMQEQSAFPAVQYDDESRLVSDGAIEPPLGSFVIFICSGPRRKGDFAEWVESTSTLKVLNIDICLNGRHHDLTKDDVKLRLIQAATLERCVGVLVSTPCSTWSAARFNEGGPAVLRDIERPMGIPDAGGVLPKQVEEANLILSVAIDVAWAVVSTGGCFIIEQPVSRASGSPQSIPGREKHATLSTFPRLQKLLHAYRSLSVVFEQCRVGAKSQKATELLSSPSIFDKVVQHFGALRCNHIECRKYSLLGSSSPGTGAGSEIYTSQMCELLAKCFVSVFDESAKSGEGNSSPVSIMGSSATAQPGAPCRPDRRAVRTKNPPGTVAVLDTIWRRLAYPAAEAWANVPKVMKNVGLPKGAVMQAKDPSTIPAVQAGRMRARCFPGIPDGTPNRPLQTLYMDFCGPFWLT